MDVIYFLSILTFLSNVLVALSVVLFLLYRAGFFKNMWLWERSFIEEHALQILLLVSVVATSGSLYFSEILGFTPCRLCWYQRIFMYPQVILILIAYIKKTNDVLKYILTLSIIGLFIAVYHYILQIYPNPYAPCGDVGYSVSCSVDFFKYFGYITIPWMSLSAFLINVFISLIVCKKRDGRFK